jgi:hypothetical protein
VTIFSVIIEEIGHATMQGANIRSLKTVHVQIDDAVDRLGPALDSVKSR